jgi:hypothetical protein
LEKGEGKNLKVLNGCKNELSTIRNACFWQFLSMGCDGKGFKPRFIFLQVFRFYWLPFLVFDCHKFYHLNILLWIFSPGNATRSCLETGEWDSRTDYNNCQTIEIPSIPKQSEDYSVSIYFVGYGLSLLALTLALIIFMTFR